MKSYYGMKITPSKLNLLLLFKLPAAYFTGVRVTYLDSEQCSTSVKFRWINQNPFKSMFWAVQGMAAELTTGALLISKIKSGKLDMSTLLLNSKGTFIKRVRGKVTFTCADGLLVDHVIAKAIETGEGQSIKMHSIGINEEGMEVSNFSFDWSIKIRE